MHTWQIQEAEAKFGKLLDECQKEPQLVTRDGEEIAYVISAVQYGGILREKNVPYITAGEFFRKSPLYASGIALDLHRPHADGSHRDIDFSDGSNTDA